jgi:hypothetical protein
MKRILRSVLVAALAACHEPGATPGRSAAGGGETAPEGLLARGSDVTAAIQEHPRIHRAPGPGASFLVSTAAGNVVIDWARRETPTAFTTCWSRPTPVPSAT